MLVIGLTGGIGSGKSTVAELFAKRKIIVIEADEIVRSLTQQEQPAYHQIRNYFEQNKEEILLPSGALDRKKIRKIVFKNTTKRVWLEQLLHPLVWREIEKRVHQVSSPYCITVVPLLLETAPHPLIQRILIVDATENQQIKRVKQRDRAPENEIKAIIQTQISRKERLAIAHDVIINHGRTDDLDAQVEKLHQFYLSLVSNKKNDSRGL